MRPAHDEHCDEKHTLRQACNAELAPAVLCVSAPIDPASEKTPAAAAGAVAALPEGPPMSNAVREAIAQILRPTPEVAHEWERTAPVAPSAPDDADDAALADNGSRGGGAVRSIAIVGLVLAVTWLLVRSRRVQAQNAGT